MPDLTLDHVVIGVRDLDAATADYASLLGRDPSWRGQHPALGTRNSLFRIENTYIELLGLNRDGRKRGPRWSADLSNFLQKGEGLYALALGTPDMDATVRELRDRALPVQDPAEGEGIDAASAAVRRWLNAMVPVKATGGVRLFFIEHRSPPDALPLAPANTDRDAYVRRMDHAVILSPDMEVSRRIWRDTLGVRLALDRSFPDRNTRILFFRLGDITVEISGGAAQAQEGVGKPDRLWGVAWGVESVANTAERLHAGGFDVSPPRPGIKPGTVVATVKGSRTHGVATLLVQHTPESFRPEAREPQGTAHDNPLERRAFRVTGLHHVTVVAGDFDAAAATWRSTLGLSMTESFQTTGAHLKLAKVPAGNAFIELTQPLSRDHRVAQWIAERGQGMYALAVEVDNVDVAAADLRSRGLFVADPEYGAWEGTRIARVDPRGTNGVNVVLVQRLPELL